VKFWDSSAVVALLVDEPAQTFVRRELELDPATLEFLCLDERLKDAAEREGFRVR
jgi:predicted nucleic acid-binding protein